MTAVLISAQTEGAGRAGNLTLKAQRLDVLNGGQITTTTFGSGNAGDMLVQVADTINTVGFYPTYIPAENASFIFSSGLFAQVERGGTGNGGNLTIETGRLRVTDGARVTTSVEEQGEGNAGNLTIRAQEVIVDGVVLNERGAFSGVLANVQGTNGSSGTLRIDTDRLQILNGGQVSASNLGTGRAGDVIVNASSIEISGESSELQLPSRLAATSTSDFPAGAVQITANDVRLNNKGVISVSSLGGGDAGNLTINARSLRLNQESSLRSESRGGTQGDIELRVSDAIVLRHGSQITTNASGTATGGNININTPILLGAENSDIVANAEQGSGGNIQITTQGIFGLKFRPQLTSGNDITASSQFGVSGTVAINDPGIDPTSGLLTLPLDLVDSSQQIATGCSGIRGSSFVATGRGGLPQNPTQAVRGDRPWSDLRDPSAYRNPTQTRAAVLTSPSPIVEASTLKQTNGQLELVAVNSPAPLPQTATCARAIVPAL